MYTFSCQDEKEQFEERLKIIADEELKELKKKQFTENLQRYIKERSQYYKENPEVLGRFLGRSTKVDDYDYQMDVDSELSELRLETPQE